MSPLRINKHLESRQQVENITCMLPWWIFPTFFLWFNWWMKGRVSHSGGSSVSMWKFLVSVSQKKMYLFLNSNLNPSS